MNAETFKEIHQPMFLGYFYKNEEEQDKVVSVPKMFEMFDQVQTPENKKIKVAFPESGDHVIASSITSKDWEGVLRETKRFLEEVASISVPAKEPGFP